MEIDLMHSNSNCVCSKQKGNSKIENKSQCKLIVHSNNNSKLHETHCSLSKHAIMHNKNTLS